MAVLGLTLLVLIFTLGVCCLVSDRRRRAPRELRGDWWTQFEAEFRDYCRRQSGERRDAHRRPPGMI